MARSVVIVVAKSLDRKATRVSFVNDEKGDSFSRSTDGSEGEILADFCGVLAEDTYDFACPVLINGDPSAYVFYSLDPVLLENPPKDAVGPISLSEALHGDLLTARDKIQLAFTISKSFWQLYKSDWMHSVWDLNTLLILPPKDGRRSMASVAESPLLSVRSKEVNAYLLQEHEVSDPANKKRLFHRHPYILNLGVLLVSLCDPTIRIPHDLNSKYLSCKSAINRQEWPAIDLSEQAKDRYRGIVRHCFPEIRTDIGSSSDERRQLLLDKVVYPLKDLLQDLETPAIEDKLTDWNAGFQGFSQEIDRVDRVRDDHR